MALVDQKTPRLGLLLPFTDNFLQDDVERLRDTLNLLDVLVVTRDQTTGKIADDMLSDVIAKLDANGKLNKANLPSTVVQTGPDGKIDGSLMPSIAVIDTFPVPNEASMLGLQCERGDIAIREDLGKTFILTQMPPSVLSNWRELTSTNVTSVNGQTGAITGLAKSGVNNDITGLNALSGPLRLGGEAAGDYDAVTLKQLRAASGGAGGASMNGVMNNFIGAVEWFNGSRAKIPAGYIAADGQECSQTDPATADLYAAVSAGLFATVTEALWQNSGNADTLRKGENRGKYVAQSSTGKFRVPDLNGATTDGATPSANFLRGDGGGRFTAEIGDVGAIKYNAAPNITASTSTSVLLGGSTSGQVGGGAFTPKNSVVGTGKATTTGDTPITYMNPLDFNASLSNAAYGRGTEVRPNSVTGIWIIRASGLFTAQNTAFHVLNSAAAEPPVNFLAQSGIVRAQYLVGAQPRISAEMYSEFKWGSPAVQASMNFGVVSYNANGSVAANATMKLYADGSLTTPGGMVAGRCSWNGTNFGSAAMNGSFMVLYPDGVSAPGIYVKKRDASNSYSSTFVYNESADSWVSSSSVRANRQLQMAVGTMGYANMWNAAAIRLDRFTAQNGSENYQSFIAGAAVTDGIGFSGGVSYGMFTTGGNTWPAAQISIATRDADPSGNFGTMTTFRMAADGTLSYGGYNGYGTFQQIPGSDRRMKHDIEDYDGAASLENIEAMRFRTFIFNNDEQNRVRRGVISQELEEVDPQYVKTRTYTDNGKTIEQKELDTAPLLMDALAAIKVLSARVKKLESAQK